MKRGKKKKKKEQDLALLRRTCSLSYTPNTQQSKLLKIHKPQAPTTCTFVIPRAYSTHTLTHMFVQARWVERYALSDMGWRSRGDDVKRGHMQVSTEAMRGYDFGLRGRRADALMPKTKIHCVGRKCDIQPHQALTASGGNKLIYELSDC
jgi:hypothetical protein